MARLGDIATVITKGTTPTSIGFAFENDGINFVKIESVDENGNFICEKFDHISDECHEKLKRSQLQENDILFSIAGAIGRTAIVTKDILPANTNQALAIIRIPQGAINYSFLLYILQSSVVLEQAEKKKQGVAQLNLSLKDIGDFIIPDIPLEEQQCIVDSLDKVSNLISLRKQQLSKLDELVKSRFIEMFGDPVSNPFRWSTLTMKQASIRLSDGPFGSNLKSEHYTDEGVRVIRLGNIGCGYFNDEDQSYISPEHYATIKKYTCRAGEIVIATLGDPNLRACIVPDHIEYGVNKSDCVHYIPKAEILNNQFVCQYINCPETLSLASGMVHGQTRSRISSGQLADLPIYLPPMDLQQQFAAFVEQNDKSKFEIQTSLEKLETLKKALMQKYFG